MENPITIREAVTENDAAAFWEQLHMYFKRDIFPDPNDRNREYFLSDSEYRAHVQKIHDRPEDLHLLEKAQAPVGGPVCPQSHSDISLQKLRCPGRRLSAVAERTVAHLHAPL